MSTTVRNTAGVSDAEPANLSAEAVIAQLRSMLPRDAAPLSKEQRRQVKKRLQALSAPVVEASINVIGVLDNVSQAIGQSLDEVRQLQDEALRWDAAAEEARAFLKSIEGANLMRRQRLALIASAAYTIGSQLAKDPAKAVLVPHVEEVKRLKGVLRRKKATHTASAPPAATLAPASAPVPVNESLPHPPPAPGGQLGGRDEVSHERDHPQPGSGARMRDVLAMETHDLAILGEPVRLDLRPALVMVAAGRDHAGDGSGEDAEAQRLALASGDRPGNTPIVEAPNFAFASEIGGPRVAAEGDQAAADREVVAALPHDSERDQLRDAGAEMDERRPLLLRGHA